MFMKNRNMSRKNKVEQEDHMKELRRNELNDCSKPIDNSEPINNHCDVRTLINLSSYVLKKDEVKVLEKGLSFVPEMYFNMPKMIAELETGVYNLGVKEKNAIRAEVTTCLLKLKSQTDKRRRLMDGNHMKVIKALRGNHNIVIQKADKGNITVVMDKMDYDNKIKALLDDEITYIKLTKNPLKGYVVNNELKKISKCIGSDLYKKLKPNVPKHLIFMGFQRYINLGYLCNRLSLL